MGFWMCRWSEQKTLRRVSRKINVSQELHTLDGWAMRVSYDEDAKFRDKKWNVKFDPETGGPSFVKHDATGVPWLRPENASQQRSLFSDYYGTCCAKGGVSNQLCGWIRGRPLMTGIITNSQMIKDSLEMNVQSNAARCHGP